MDMIDLAYAIANALESMPDKVAENEALRDSMLIPSIPSALTTKTERRAFLEECSDRYDRLAHVVNAGRDLIANLTIARKQIGTPESWQGENVAPAPGWRVIAGIEGTVMRAERYINTSH